MSSLTACWRPLAVLLTAVTYAGCRSGTVPAASHAVSYRLEWSWNGATVEASGGWQTVNDRGYRVRLERGYLVDYSMELVECPKEALQSGLDASWPWLPVRSAWAGHMPTTPNPAAIHTPHIEALHAPTDFEVGSLPLAAQRYCRIHYLIARANRSAVGLPEDVDMVERSLYVRGTYQSADAPEPRPFELATSAANAVLTQLFPPGQYGVKGAAFVVDTGRENARVVMHRQLGTLFNGVDFAAQPGARIERQLLQNLIDGTQIAVHRSSDD
jgi:hypothetical protein